MPRSVAPFTTYFRAMRVAVEVCVTSVEEAMAAERAGADSVELCNWLAVGGITPSSGLVDAVRTAVRIPVRVLIRPGIGDFVYDAPAVHALLLDAEIYGGGAIGLVTGALLSDGRMNPQLISSVKQLAPESEITFHRAIDHSAAPLDVLDACMDLGVDRILTAGASTLAEDGIPLIAALVHRAQERCTVAAAGGINPGNVVRIVESTGVPEVHFAAQRQVLVENPKAALTSTPGSSSFMFVPDEAKIAGVIEALVKAGLR
jgi:copper homeostasis protein